METKTYEHLIQDFLEKNTTQETLFTGLASEFGEVMSERVKETRNQMEKSKEILDELSDVLWYITSIANSRGYTLGQLMIDNYLKLEKRSTEGKEEKKDE
ncbi:nucleotide pyrophosphohydrolase domain protein [Roseobacter phage CRP-7]|nr:nucleotide pyrophosphohydrolase domain protein [Roseobacter phage CRP-7]